jgi:hypothetical protein
MLLNILKILGLASSTAAAVIAVLKEAKTEDKEIWAEHYVLFKMLTFMLE